MVIWLNYDLIAVNNKCWNLTTFRSVAVKIAKTKDCPVFVLVAYFSQPIRMPIRKFLRFDWFTNVSNQNNQTVFFRLDDFSP